MTESKRWPGPRKAGRSRLLRVVLGVFVLTAALVGPLQSASAAPRPSTCDDANTIAWAGTVYDHISHPGDEFCIGIWLESGKTYVFQVDLMNWTSDPEFGATGKALRDSVLYVHRSSQPWWNVWNYDLVGYNDDIAYPANLASRVVYNAPASTGPHHYWVRVRGYGNDYGGFRLSIAERQCGVNWIC